MKALTIALVGILCSSQANGFYFDFEKFLQPIINPHVQTFGSAIFKFSFHENQHVAQFDSRQVEPQKQHLQEQNNVEADVYKAIGLPDDVVYSEMLPVLMSVRLDLQRYFNQHSIQATKLHESLIELKELVEKTIEKYFKNVNNLNLGNSKDGKVADIFIKNPQQIVQIASENAQKKKQVEIKNNIVKISNYKIDLNKVVEATIDPNNCVKILNK